MKPSNIKLRMLLSNKEFDNIELQDIVVQVDTLQTKVIDLSFNLNIHLFYHQIAGFDTEKYKLQIKAFHGYFNEAFIMTIKSKETFENYHILPASILCKKNKMRLIFLNKEIEYI